MTELPFEREAMRGDPMPDDLDFIDSIMYQGLSALYFRYFHGWVSQEQGKKEKGAMIYKYSIRKNAESYQKIMYKWYADLRKNIEAAQNRYRKERTLEAADMLLDVLDGMVRHE